jgi:hypothetical protein
MSAQISEGKAPVQWQSGSHVPTRAQASVACSCVSSATHDHAMAIGLVSRKRQVTFFLISVSQFRCLLVGCEAVNEAAGNLLQSFKLLLRYSVGPPCITVQFLYLYESHMLGHGLRLGESASCSCIWRGISLAYANLGSVQISKSVIHSGRALSRSVRLSRSVSYIST